MNRSTGVTISAVLVFIGSGFTMLMGAFAVFGLMIVPEERSQPAFVRYALLFAIAMYWAFGIWGILSGVGLLRLREWARISMLVFSGLLLLFTVPGLVFIPLMPFPQPENAPANLAFAIKLGMGIFYGILAGIGGGWLYFFNKRTVKDQFRSPAGSAPGTPRPSARPLSITIIGWLMVVGAGFVLVLPFWRLPVFAFGFMLTGWRASLFMWTSGAVQFIAGVGLLRLKPWGRTLSICSFSFGIVNGLSSVLLPGSHSRFEQVMALVQTRMGVPQAPMSFQFPMVFGMIFGVLFIAVQLWFVVTRKQAFAGAQGIAAPKP